MDENKEKFEKEYAEAEEEAKIDIKSAYEEQLEKDKAEYNQSI